MTPLLAATSAFTTWALVDPHRAAVAAIVSVVAAHRLRRLQLHDVGRHHLAGDDVIGEDARSFALFSGLSSDLDACRGQLANASSVGANTVNGPAPLSVSTSPAASRAFASVLNEPAATAVSTMSFDWRPTGVLNRKDRDECGDSANCELSST